MRQVDLAILRSRLGKELGSGGVCKAVRLVSGRTGEVEVHLSTAAERTFGIGPKIRGNMGHVIKIVETAVAAVTTASQV